MQGEAPIGSELTEEVRVWVVLTGAIAKSLALLAAISRVTSEKTAM